MAVFNEVLDYVDEKQNSSTWPSSDPKDSPFNTFTCKLCGWAFDVLMYGSFPAGVDPYDDVKKSIIEHLVVRHKISISLNIV